MARTTISISDDLKKRMDRIKEPVNWSAVAAQAFELKLGEIAHHRKEKTMDNVIERLRASKIRSGSNAENNGREVGVLWAKEAAEFNELRRLSKLDMDQFFDESGWSASNAYAPAEILAFAILGADAPYTRSDATDFWDPIVGSEQDAEESLQSLDFLRGFAEGALEIFEQVEDAL